MLNGGYDGVSTKMFGRFIGRFLVADPLNEIFIIPRTNRHGV